jgi:hypothetical protein
LTKFEIPLHGFTIYKARERVKDCFATLKLPILAAQNHIKPLTDQELQKLHEIKRSFGAKINTE